MKASGPSATLPFMRPLSLLVGTLLMLMACEGLPLTREPKVQRFETVAATVDRDSDARVIEFAKAIPRPDLLGSKTWSVRGNRDAYSSPRMAVMIPVVDEGWTKEQPVVVWVRLDASTDDLNDPRMQAKIDALVAAAAAGPLRVNATQSLPEEVDMEGTNAFTIGAKRAMQEHGLVSPVGAVLATWPAATHGSLRLKV